MNSTQEYGATLVRLALGTMWISHAMLKVLVFTIAGFEQFLAAHGLPAWTALPVVSAEIAGGTLILLGIGGRRVSLVLLPILVVALSTHWANGWVFSAPNGGWEYPLFLIAMSVAHALLGDGAFALGNVRARRTPALVA
ncbi:MAG TPA: DoxX family protein [Xanthomonadales bacterium]|nr:DoxX family protein [Xanthomonadales bacterium]